MEAQNFNLPLTFQQVADIVKQLPKSEKKILVDLLNKDELDCDSTHTHLASQKILEQDWLNQEEDQAWQHL